MRKHIVLDISVLFQPLIGIPTYPRLFIFKELFPSLSRMCFPCFVLLAFVHCMRLAILCFDLQSRMLFCVLPLFRSVWTRRRDQPRTHPWSGPICPAASSTFIHMSLGSYQSEWGWLCAFLVHRQWCLLSRGFSSGILGHLLRIVCIVLDDLQRSLC